MKKFSDMEKIKSTAVTLLRVDISEPEYSPMIVQHPFTSSGIVYRRWDGVLINQAADR